MNMLPIAFLAAIAVGGIAYVFLYPLISGERQAEKRRESVARAEPTVRATRGQQRSRRDMVEASLKELEEKTKKQKLSLTTRIGQAGLTWSKRQFILISAAVGFALFMIAFAVGPGLVPALAIGFAGAFGLPRWLLSYLKKRRELKFLAGFPDAVDIIVRGVKAGLPLLDCMKMVATEAPDPVKTEFRVVVDTQAIGMPLGEACGKLYERTPVPEANFFGIVVSIQQKAGGNLSEALGNLSRVLRDRKKMKAKIRAMSQEAKASAGIIGSLPIAVMILVSLTSKDYITLLFTEPLGHLMLAGSAVWMTCGVLVMRKMINFDF
ncbi:MAG TPA: type II secretion system F family protein [Pseudolabrys sp.]|jgi:tight adherence protein B|nr:type II secretion system F family protein [Pseudolabrys sp.]